MDFSIGYLRSLQLVTLLFHTVGKNDQVTHPKRRSEDDACGGQRLGGLDEKIRSSGLTYEDILIPRFESRK